MACPEGLEPPTPSLEGWCSIQLSYGQTTSRILGGRPPSTGASNVFAVGTRWMRGGWFVHRVLAGNCAPVHPSPLRPSRIDPYRLFIEQTLVKLPTSARACSGGDRYKPTMEPSMPAPAENASERRWRER